MLQVKVYVQQLVEGLQYLHSHSVLHLDIKVLSPHGCPGTQEGQVGAWGLQTWEGVGTGLPCLDSLLGHGCLWGWGALSGGV